MTSATTAIQNIPNPSQSVGGMVFKALAATATGAAAGAFIPAVGPVGGAVFGLSGMVTGQLMGWVSDKIDCCPNNLAVRVAKFALTTLASVAAAAAITTMVGFPITITAGLALTGAMIGVSVAAALVFGGCVCSTLIASGIALGNIPQELQNRV